MKRSVWLAANLVSLLLIGCVGEGDDAGTSAAEFDYVGMMANYADNLIVPQYRAFAQLSGEISGSDGDIAAYCEALGTAEEATARDRAQAAWRELMASWQQAELLLVGPAADNGAALRNRIYSYNSNSRLSTCAVDQSVVLAQEEDFAVGQRSFNSRGLDALEYLLFREELDHTCPARIAETQNWNQQPAIERKAARCHYARLIAADVEAAADSLVAAWQEDGGYYRYDFVDPANQEDNLSAVSDALFYIETETKDAKLGIPTGIHSACSQAACPQTVESRFSETSLANIRNNLLAFRRGFNGGDGLGFDDIIVAEGFPEVAQRFNAQVDAALALIDQPQQSLDEQTSAILASGDASGCLNSAANPDTRSAVPACALHGLIKRITDSLRTDFVTIVNLDLPDRAQSDND